MFSPSVKYCQDMMSFQNLHHYHPCLASTWVPKLLSKLKPCLFAYSQLKQSEKNPFWRLKIYGTKNREPKLVLDNDLRNSFLSLGHRSLLNTILVFLVVLVLISREGTIGSYIFTHFINWEFKSLENFLWICNETHCSDLTL